MTEKINVNNRFVISYYNTGGSVNNRYRHIRLQYRTCPNFVRNEAQAMEYWIRFNARPNGDVYGRKFVEIIAPNAIKTIKAA